MPLPLGEVAERSEDGEGRVNIYGPENLPKDEKQELLAKVEKLSKDLKERNRLS